MRTSVRKLAERASASERLGQSRPVRKGDIRRIHALPGLEAPTRSALVVRTEPIYGHVEIMLTHDRVEMSGSGDVVFHPDADELPNGVVVQTRLRGLVWHLQLTSLVTRLSSQQMAEVARVASRPGLAQSDENASIQRSDEWEAFRELELKALWALTGDCTDAMLDDDVPWRIDPALLSAELLDGYAEPSVVLAEVMHILRTRQVTATFDDLQILQESGALQASTWMSTGYGSDLASQIAAGIRLMMERALSSTPTDEPHSPGDPSKFELLRRVAKASDLSLVSGSRLVTAPFLWADAGHELLHSTQPGPGQEGSDLEIMMVATPDSDLVEREDESDGE